MFVVLVRVPFHRAEYRAAHPGHLLHHVHAVLQEAVGHLDLAARAREDVGGGAVPVVADDRRGQGGGVHRPRLGDERVLNQRIDALDAQVEVLLQRQGHRFVDGQASHRAGWLQGPPRQDDIARGRLGAAARGVQATQRERHEHRDDQCAHLHLLDTEAVSAGVPCLWGRPARRRLLRVRRRPVYDVREGFKFCPTRSGWNAGRGSAPTAAGLTSRTVEAGR